MSLASILVVDDNQNLRDDLVELLELADYAVIAAKDGAKAYEMLAGNKVDLIISDYEMPVMDGLQLLHTIRQSDGLPDIPFILISGMIDLDPEVKNDHNFRFLRKPVSLDELLTTIDQILK